MDKIVIIGAGRAGVYAAFSLREHGFAGRITLVNAEPELPYDRPPLSKQVLMGEQTHCDIQLKRPWEYEKADIEMLTGCHAVEIDRQQQSVTTSDGRVWRYDKLLLATGGLPRKFPEHIDPGQCVHYLRNADDASRLRIALSEHCQQRNGKGKVAIVGAGVIGLEVAAVASQLGLEVTVIEMAERVMQRLLPQPIARAVQQIHEERGVDFLLGKQVNKIDKAQEHDKATLVLSDNTVLEADIVIAGLGMVPETRIAQKAGLMVQNGIVTSAYGQTSDDAIFCAGDVSLFYHPVFDDYIQVESWQHAQLHGENSAINMLGCEEVYQAIPWMWSDQYDRSLQVVGLPSLAGAIVLRDLGEGNMLAMALKDDVLVGAVGFGSSKIGKEIRAAQQLIAKQAVVPRRQLEAKGMTLKQLLKSY